MMMNDKIDIFQKTAWIIACLTLLISNVSLAEEVKEERESTENVAAAKNADDNAGGDDAQSNAPASAESTEVQVSSPPPQTAKTELQPIQTEPTPQATPPQNTIAELRKKPRRLRPIEGEQPPLGYVEIEKRKKGLIISGSVVFGSVYLGCLIASTAGDRMLAIPLAGPMIAGYNGPEHVSSDYDSDYEKREYEDAKYAARLFGTLGTLAQATGIALFIAGMASKKKVWLRQDLAGIKMQMMPTVVGSNGPGFGMVGTF